MVTIMISMLYSMMSYRAKLIGKDMSRYKKYTLAPYGTDGRLCTTDVSAKFEVK